MDPSGDCPLCGGPTTTMVRTGDAFSCRKCGHIAGVERASHRLEDIYSHGSYAGFGPDPVFLENLRSEFERIRTLAPPPRRLLDVGCGNGDGLGVAAEMGYEALGIDISQAAVEQCRRRGLRAETARIGDDHLGEWDVVTLWDVIEHIPEPVSFLTEVRHRLRPGGLVYLKTPTLDARHTRAVLWPSRRIGSLVLHLPGHVNTFSADSLSRALTQSGFAVEFIETRGSMRGRRVGGQLRQRLTRAIVATAAKVAAARNLVAAART